jgi:hypothetical protein
MQLDIIKSVVLCNSTMKFLLSLAILFIVKECYASVAEEKCAFECTDEGVKLQCSYTEMRCKKYKEHFNTQTENCEPINCPNMNCAGKENEFYSTNFVRAHEEACELKYPLTFLEKLGCACKEGFCRENGVCVTRTKPRQEVDYSQSIIYT